MSEHCPDCNALGECTDECRPTREHWPEMTRERAERAEVSYDWMRLDRNRWREQAENSKADADRLRQQVMALENDGMETAAKLGEAEERIASLMLEEPSKTAGLYAAIDELQAEIEQVRVTAQTYRLSSEQREAQLQDARAEVERLHEAIRRLLYHAGPITPETPCRCGSTQPAHYCDYAMQAERDALKLVPDA